MAAPASPPYQRRLGRRPGRFLKVSIGHVAALVLLYLLGVAAAYTLADRTLQDAAWNTMEGTARLLGSEMATALGDHLLDLLSTDRTESRARITSVLDDFVGDSDLVASAAMIDADGKVVAATSPGAAQGGPTPTPKELFGADRRPRLSAIRGSRLRSGVFILDLPLVRAGEPVAYLRVHLDSSPLARLYGRARTRLLAVAGIGLVVIGVLALTLHLQLSRRDRAVLSTLEHALTDQPVEFGRHAREVDAIVEAAQRLGTSLHQERARVVQAQEGLSLLGPFLDVGVLLVGPGGALDFAGRHARELLSGGDPGCDDAGVQRFLERLAGTMQRAVASGRSISVDVDLDGGPAANAIRAYVQPVEPEGSGGCVVVLRDRRIVEALETDLRQASQLRSLARLYVGVAHDLKTPLNAIVLNLALLKDSLSDAREQSLPPTSDQLESLQVLEDELARLRRALQALLTQTAPSEGRKEPFSLAEVLAEVQHLLAPQARQQRITLDVRTPSSSPPVFGRRDVIKQAILNLAVNALEAMPDGGTLLLELLSDGGLATVRVTDTGTGIPDDLRERIFEMHVTTKSTGTGIGLHVSRTVAENEGGSLRLAATGPGGTAFELSLPVLAESV